jgi:putative redox protein
MVEIEVSYEGELHTRCLHGPSGRELETDAPIDNEGRGESFSPTDLLATALGTCMMTVMGIVAGRHAWKLEGARVRVEKHMVADPVRRVGKLVVRFAMPPGLDAVARKTLEQAARTCPVALSLHPDVVVDAAFAWREGEAEA